MFFWPVRRQFVLGACALATLGIGAGAQGSPPAAAAAVCLGFSFGDWNPPLNWQAAGQGEMPDSSVLQRAAPGRDWASTLGGGSPTGADSLLVLYPSWWPAGVGVDISPRTPAVGDTVSGQATAFVADGSKRSPVSRIRAWRQPCGEA